MNSYLPTRLLSLVLIALGATATLHATQLPLIADASVNSARPSTNLGGLSNLYIGNGSTTFLRFDLGTLPAGTTASQIAHATLTVFINRVNAAGPVTLSPATGAWTESGVTQETIPTIGAPAGTFTAATAGQFITLDVTAIVQGWVTTPATDFGFALSSATANLLLDSKENDETGHAASLDITITSEGATGLQGPQGIQGSVGPVGSQGLAGLQGLVGLPGLLGPQGVQGIAGPVGPIGLIGTTGLPGVSGISGAAGTTGAAGAGGAVGPTGPAGTIDIVNNWFSSTTYQIGQVVFCAACSSNGSSYVATAANTNQDPPTQTGIWQLIAQAGATGPTGAQGIEGSIGATGATGPAGATGAAVGVLDFADFYALMPPDNAATVAVGTDVSFPGDGPASGSGLIARTSASSINLSDIGTYQVLFQVSVDEAGQLILTLNGADLAYTAVGRATGTSQIVGIALVQTTIFNSILTVRNPAGNSTALTITPLAGGTSPASAHLVITRIQ